MIAEIIDPQTTTNHPHITALRIKRHKRDKLKRSKASLVDGHSSHAASLDTSPWMVWQKHPVMECIAHTLRIFLKAASHNGRQLSTNGNVGMD